MLPDYEKAKVKLEWSSDPINDMIADSIIAVILQADSSPASVKGNIWKDSLFIL